MIYVEKQLMLAVGNTRAYFTAIRYGYAGREHRDEERLPWRVGLDGARFENQLQFTHA